jgi:hypothetical protein
MLKNGTSSERIAATHTWILCKKEHFFLPKEWRRSVMKFYLPCGGNEKLLKNVINFAAQREGMGACMENMMLCGAERFSSSDSIYQCDPTLHTSWLNVCICPSFI